MSKEEVREHIARYQKMAQEQEQERLDILRICKERLGGPSMPAAEAMKVMRTEFKKRKLIR